MKTFKIMIAVVVLSTMALSGCGTANQPQSNTVGNTPVNSTTQSPSGMQGETSSNIKDGVAKMLATANELKNEISTGNDSKIKETGPKLEDTWHSFEDSVKQKYPDSYGTVEQYLDPTVAGSKATPLDKQALSKLNDQLIQALSNLQKKVHG
jgi:iron uptake system EfeUOB component EfeO/EfeM